MYHTWFGGNTKWRRVSATDPGPAPGYVVGGPNASYAKDNPDGLVPPKGEPAQKSYIDGSNTLDWRKAIWELSEPALGYQGAYVKLLSSFVP
jgi:endoglucanase